MDEPVARRTIFIGFRQAALDLWGPEGLSDCAARLDDEVRRHCIEPAAIKEDMLPERYVLAWYAAAWEGPARRNRARYNAWLQRMMDLGFGRVRKLLLGWAKPEAVIRQCPALWRHDHSHGTLSYEIKSPSCAAVTLEDHPYVETPLGRASISEIYRYAIALANTGGDVTSTHHMASPRSLVVQVTWQARARASAPR